MGLIDNPLSSILEKVLAHHSQRHDVIASNIANANTPGYTAFDLALRSQLEGVAPLLVRSTDSRHMTSCGVSQRYSPAPKELGREHPGPLRQWGCKTHHRS